ncbi:MAG TPA: DNA mismatch repair protein MutS [Chloroflexota bacterium]
MTSPAHRQYLAVKDRYPDAIVLFRMGDFYEMFGEDATTGARALGITLTSREFARGDRVPMAGIPHHALQSYLKRFVQQGMKVAICEQLSEPGKGLVERDVVRVVTPGTLVEPALLEETENNYLAAVNIWHDAYGLAYVDVTTGEFAVTEFSGPEAKASLEAELLRLGPSETLVASDESPIHLAGHITLHDEYRFDPTTAREALCRQFGVRTLEGFGCEHLLAAVGAAGAVVSYVERANRSLLGLLGGLRTYGVTSFMTIDRYTRRNLELTESARSGGVRGSLLWVLDRTQTAMGGRLLRRLIGQPLLQIDELQQRLNAVGELHGLPVLRAQLRTVLTKVADIERLSGRICQGVASPHDLIGLSESLRSLREMEALLSDAEATELRRVRDDLDPCTDIADLIERAIHAPGVLKDRKGAAEGPLKEGLIKPAYSAELDEMKAAIRDSREWIARLEAVEQSRTGVKSLKVGYNKVFGYYIEVRNANLGLVPADYVRKQTLVNAERFITPELKEHEARILQAEERIGALERRLFAELLEQIAAERERLFATAHALAFLDVYRALADVAGQNNYVRPELGTDDRLDIVAGRHPVVEVTLDDAGFIPNGCVLDCAERQVLLITGPNMGGKSTFLRQVALIVLMAQIGSFVPAESAYVGLVDRIFTRVGAQDDIAAGQSTFMVEMVETANILNHATARSLLVLDEVGRGTSTWDGLAIARAVVEYVHDRVGARTLFATHYHELTALADRFARIHNIHVSVAEDAGQVIFLHRVVPGGADRSYGIHVARLAGLPAEVTERADDALRDLESKAQENGHRRGRSRAQQLMLFGEPGDGVASRVLDDILSLDVTNLTPLEALTRLHELQQKGRGG